MKKIHLQKPYKILYNRLKRYSLHYEIPAENCVVIPLESFGDDFACDVRWEDNLGVLHLKTRLFFTGSNIEPVNEMKQFNLYELWQHYDNMRASATTVNLN